MRAVTARWLVPGDRPPLPGGVLVTRGDRIVAVESRRGDLPAQDLGDVAILPALVNAHTHLEWSHCQQPLGQEGVTFPQWLAEVVAWRRKHGDPAQAVQVAAGRRAALSAGLDELRTSGVAAVGEIAYAGFPTDLYTPAPWPGRLFLELLGWQAARIPEQLAEARQHVARWGTDPRRLAAGLSPHAPYSTHPDLIAGAVALAVEAGVPVAMHLAESPEEIELLSTGAGPLAEVLLQLGVRPADFLPGSASPLDYLRVLRQAPHALVIHGNYLQPEEHAYLATHRQRMTLVYCPRTHAYFRHAPYPLARLLAAGVRVAVGTDSRASNPDLQLWHELTCIARHHPEISPEDVLTLGTQAGAEALGLADELGSLTPGKRAAWIAVPLAGGNLWDALWSAPGPIRGPSGSTPLPMAPCKET